MQKLLSIMLLCWWRFQMKCGQFWYSKDLVSLAGISDSEFLQNIDHWRAHPSFFVRVVCSRRWIKTTWPDDEIGRHEEDGRLLWERRRIKQ